MTVAAPYRVLFLCTGNSARSIMAEALLNILGEGRFEAFSAGSHPTGRVQPLAAELAVGIGYPAERLWSKSWDEFAGDGAPPMDFVITVCDNAAGETCPAWLGSPVTAHWGVPDPAQVAGDDVARRTAYGVSAGVVAPAQAHRTVAGASGRAACEPGFAGDRARPCSATRVTTPPVVRGGDTARWRGVIRHPAEAGSVVQPRATMTSSMASAVDTRSSPGASTCNSFTTPSSAYSAERRVRRPMP